MDKTLTFKKKYDAYVYEYTSEGPCVVELERDEKYPVYIYPISMA